MDMAISLEALRINRQIENLVTNNLGYTDRSLRFPAEESTLSLQAHLGRLDLKTGKGDRLIESRVRAMRDMMEFNHLMVTRSYSKDPQYRFDQQDKLSEFIDELPKFQNGEIDLDLANLRLVTASGIAI